MLSIESLSIRLERLALLGPPITLEPLLGGMTNRNYVVRSRSGTHVARLCEPRRRLGIDRRNESLCHAYAAGLGLAPALIHREEDLLITQWIDGRALTPADLHDRDTLTAVVRVLQRLHSAWEGLCGPFLYFCPFQTVRAYARTAASLGAVLDERLPGSLEHLRSRAREVRPFRPVLCHNDLLAGNLMADRDRVWLVDWEYGGMGNPLFDLANLSANSGLSAEQDAHLLDTYTRAATTAAQVADFQLFKAVAFLRESLWGAIQTVESKVEFNYAEYATTNYQAYMQAWLSLG